MKKVFTTGTFDILHYGHVSLLRRARALGDYLIVGVNVNPEGKTPFYSYEERKEILMSIKYVDEVIPIYKQKDKMSFLKYIDIFACGEEYRDYYDIKDIEKSVKVVFLSRTPGISTTKEKGFLKPQERFRTICVDIDDTILTTENRDFEHSIPRQDVIDKINAFHNAGYKVILSTARGAKSCATIEERIAKYDALTRQWLKEHFVKYDELWFGKPNADFYVDDKNMSIEQFLGFENIDKAAPIQVQAELDTLLTNYVPDNEKIDIIVPWVDPNDENWRKDYEYWRNAEIQAGIQSASNIQAFGTERTRDWNAFNYWFRGVEKNCPWVNKVFLVVQRESQIPKWLNLDNPKLRIVLHKEFIPAELLPVFSTLIIETFYYRIKDLSNHFIVCNDDFYFLHPIEKEWFFKNNRLQYGSTGVRPRNWCNGSNTWSKIVNNNTIFIEHNILHSIKGNYIHYSHLPDGRDKEYEIKFMNKYYADIYGAISVSKFRHPNNLIPSLLFIDSMKYENYSEKNIRTYAKSGYAELSRYTPWNNLKNMEMLCLNDTAASNNGFEQTQKQLIKFLNELLPEKCSFEK